MDIYMLSLAAVAAYLLGSVPNAVWLGKIFCGKDVRDHYSGNAGATNTVRVLGPGLGFAVFSLDILKGFLAVHLSFMVEHQGMPAESQHLVRVILGVCAVIGHIFPVFAQFRGGKGVSTLIGISVVILPEVLLVSFILFVLVFLISRYVSLASVVASLAFPFATVFIFKIQSLPLILFSLAVAVFIPIMHHRNIGRLIRGEEHRFYFRKSAP